MPSFHLGPGDSKDILALDTETCGLLYIEATSFIISINNSRVY